MRTNSEMQCSSSASTENVFYTLICDELRLTVEFVLGRGEFGRIGSAPEMEISLPLVGFSEEECRISLDEAGALWLIRKGHELPIQIDTPSFFRAGPYRFLIREKFDKPFPPPPTTAHESPVPPTEITSPNREPPSKVSKARLMTPIMLTFTCLGVAAWSATQWFTNHFEGERQALTTPATVVEKPKAMEPEPAPPDTNKEPERMPVPPKATDPKAPVAPQLAGNLTPTPARESEQMDLEKLAVTVVPCVFLINVFDVSGRRIGNGTGFSVSADGLVATNHHVVEKGHTYSLVTSHGAKYDNAEVVVSDPDTDLALLKIEAKDLPYLPLAKSSKVPIGKRVAVYGSPQGLAGSLSEGIISASERNLTESHPDQILPNKGALIQTTVAISPGSSGSPLFDAEGKVIGVMALTRKDSQSLNFAIPVEALKSLINRTKRSWTLVKPKSHAPQNRVPAKSSTIDATVQADPDFRRLSQLMIALNWVESLKAASTLADKYPKSAFVHIHHGYCASMLKLDHQAEISYTKAIELDPRNPLAWDMLGVALSNQNQMHGALLAFEKAVSLKPDYSAAWDNIVRTSAFLGNWPKATTALNTLVQVDLKMARECAKKLANFHVPDAGFRQALTQTMALKVGNVELNGRRKFRVVGVSPADSLSVRSGPGVGFPRVISIANGAEVVVTGGGRMNGSTEWLPIDYGNYSGWVASTYLEGVE